MVRQPRRLEMSPHGNALQRSIASPPTMDANVPVPDCGFSSASAAARGMGGSSPTGTGRHPFRAADVCTPEARSTKSRLRPAIQITACTTDHHFAVPAFAGSRCPQHLHIGAATIREGRRGGPVRTGFRAVALAAPIEILLHLRPARDGWRTLSAVTVRSDGRPKRGAASRIASAMKEGARCP